MVDRDGIERPTPRDLAVAYAGFSLKPVGVFDGHPALDMPALAHHGNGYRHG